MIALLLLRGVLLCYSTHQSIEPQSDDVGVGRGL